MKKTKTDRKRITDSLDLTAVRKRQAERSELAKKGLASVREHLEENDHSVSWLAAKLGLTRQNVSDWTRVPDIWVEPVSMLTGLDTWVIRPDLYKPPQQRAA